MKRTIAHILMEMACESPCKKLFIFLQGEDTTPLEVTYSQMAKKVKTLSHFLNRQSHSKKALLLYSDNVEFITAFLACQLSGIIAIPMYPPRGSKHADRFLKILTDATVDIILTTASFVDRISRTQGSGSEIQKKLPIIATDQLPEHIEQGAVVRGEIQQNISFIQYTSGSTGDPKGVIITHENLLHNQQLIKDTFGCNESSVICSWLPFYHDMGLIGNILHAIYAGCTAVLMSPFDFMQKPQRWLQAITTYKATHSGGPNFAFDLCINEIHQPEDFDLSSWTVAYNGSEPVHPETMDRFAIHFKKSGFKKKTFYPCYGLAEATLLVSSITVDRQYQTLFLDSKKLAAGELTLAKESDPVSKGICSSGTVVEGMDVKIFNQETQQECNAFQVGEICIAGKSVSSGYFGRDNSSFFIEENSKKYFKTGDLGFFREEHLFIVGRIKEMLIIRGKNYYPQDIEFAISSIHRSIAKNGVAAFSFQTTAGEELILFIEMRRNYTGMISYGTISKKIKNRVIEEFGIEPLDIVFLNQLAIPRTSSGKIQRFKCASDYQEKKYRALSSSLIDGPDIEGNRLEIYRDCKQALLENNNRSNILNYLEQVFVLKIPSSSFSLTDTGIELAAMGMDSLRAMEIINLINKDLEINLDAAQLYQANTIDGLVSVIETTRWLANKVTTGNELVI
jgi:acyl-CoA synthetase (AMP-forming)/AMP-acid ligase II/acyl carrier protein